MTPDQARTSEIRSSYDAETREYMKHGLHVFNAAMLGDSELEHVSRLRDLIMPPDGATVVDMGCGIGGVSRIMKRLDPASRYFGVTNVPAQIDEINDLGDVIPVQSDFHAVPLPSCFADVVMFNESIGYGQIPLLLREAYRLLKPGGILSIKDGVSTNGPAFSAAWNWQSTVPGEIDDAAEMIGLEVKASHELPFNFDRFEKFVTESEVMRGLYGNDIKRNGPSKSWYWRCIKLPFLV